jgi:hypothetical protein
MMKIKKTFSKLLDRKTISRILENKYVLYFVFILAIIHVFGYMITGNFNSIIFFGLIGFLTSFFSKNMIVIFVIALCITHVIKYGTYAYEGFEDNNDDDLLSSPNTDNSNTDNKNKVIDNKNKVMDKKNVSNDNSTELSDLKKDYVEFQGIQDKIISGMKEIDPLLTKAEVFVKKFENYKIKNIDSFTPKSSKTNDPVK